MVGHSLQLQCEKNGLPKIDKIPATYSAGDFYLQVAMQVQKELASNEACGICQWVESSCWSLTSKIVPIEASRYF